MEQNAVPDGLWLGTPLAIRAIIRRAAQKRFLTFRGRGLDWKHGLGDWRLASEKRERR